jgi:hypothetical protein
MPTRTGGSWSIPGQGPYAGGVAARSNQYAAGSAALIMCVVMLAGCFDVGGPLPVVLRNDTGAPVTVIYRVDGAPDQVLAPSIRVGADFAVNIVDFGKLDDVCEIGVQIALDAGGREMARRDGAHSGALCRTWDIGAPTPTPPPSAP